MFAMNCRIDDHIVRLLEVTGFRTYQTLKDLTEEDIKEIEDFVTKGKILNHVKEEEIG